MNFADIERQLQEMESDSKVKAARTTCQCSVCGASWFGTPTDRGCPNCGASIDLIDLVEAEGQN